MIKAWKLLTEIVGTITIVGILLLTLFCVIDKITAKPIGGTKIDDEDECPYFIDPDFENE